MTRRRRRTRSDWWGAALILADIALVGAMMWLLLILATGQAGCTKRIERTIIIHQKVIERPTLGIPSPLPPPMVPAEPPKVP